MASANKWVPEAIRFGVDRESGAEIEQLTSEPVTSTNIYCEQRFTSADGKRIAIERKPFGRPAEIWVCDLETLKICQAVTGTPLGANARLNSVYFIGMQGSRNCLMALDLQSLAVRDLFHFYTNEQYPSGAVSPDERWFITGPVPVRDNVMGLRRVNLENGRTDMLCEIEDMFNPHFQFEPAFGKLSLVQINRGAKWKSPDGKQTMTGPLGATLSLVNVKSGKVTPLPAGRPHTPPITGHECWAGMTGRILFTAGHYSVSASSFVTLKDDEAARRDPPAIYAITPGDSSAKVVARGLMFNHLAASDDCQFFIADDHADGRIYIGNIVTGKYIPLCHSHTRQGACQFSHVHAYMTPGNRHVVFNSIATGTGQVYAARIPEGFLEKIL